MTERDLTRLLDEAVPPIPAEFVDAPYPSIRRRARWRHAATTAVACGAVAVALGVVAVGIVAAPWRGAAPLLPGASPSSTVWPASQPAIFVPEARVDRAGMGLTLYVNPDPIKCMTYANLTPVLEEHPDRVVITLNGEGTKTDCDELRPAVLHAALVAPLGDRALFDGAMDDNVRQERYGNPIRPFFDADLPVLPATWRESPGGLDGELDGSWFAVVYHDAGTNRHVRIDAWTQEQPYSADAGEVTLGSRTGSLFAIGQTAGVRWQVGDLYYELKPIPNEGDDATLDTVRALIDEFTWP